MKSFEEFEKEFEKYFSKRKEDIVLITLEQLLKVVQNFNSQVTEVDLLRLVEIWELSTVKLTDELNSLHTKFDFLITYNSAASFLKERYHLNEQSISEYLRN